MAAHLIGPESPSRRRCAGITKRRLAAHLIGIPRNSVCWQDQTSSRLLSQSLQQQNALPAHARADRPRHVRRGPRSRPPSGRNRWRPVRARCPHRLHKWDGSRPACRSSRCVRCRRDRARNRPRQGTHPPMPLPPTREHSRAATKASTRCWRWPILDPVGMLVLSRHGAHLP